MKVRLAYGRSGLVIDVPEHRTTVVQPQYLPGLPDQYGAIRTALRDPVGGASPLRRIAEPSDIVAISVCDITRPMPTSTVLPVVLEELRHVPDENIVILIATGTHRPNSGDELRDMLGAQVVERYTVVNHDAFDSSGVVQLGSTSGASQSCSTGCGQRPTSGSRWVLWSHTSSRDSRAARRWSRRGLLPSKRR